MTTATAKRSAKVTKKSAAPEPKRVTLPCYYICDTAHPDSSIPEVFVDFDQKSNRQQALATVKSLNSRLKKGEQRYVLRRGVAQLELGAVVKAS